MKRIVTLLTIGLSALAGVASAQAPLPDPDYCARRDSDPEKCVIQDGPPPKPIVRKPQKPKVPPPAPPAPEKPAPIPHGRP